MKITVKSRIEGIKKSKEQEIGKIYANPTISAL
jgi:hypothetical protein